MPRAFPLERIRNIGIIAHIDAGKTTTTERILYYTGKTYKIGNIDEGTTVMDFMQQERERGITIKAAATTAYWNEHRINIIDTPGHVDFTAEVERSLRVLDGGVVVFDGVSGVEAQSETVWRQADRYKVPRICFINKMDRPGANYDYTISTIESRLKAHPLPLQMPLGKEDMLEGVIDCLELKAWKYDANPENPPVQVEIPEADRAKANETRRNLIERLAELDDQVMEAYLAGTELSVPEIKKAIRRVTLANKGVPILCGASFKNKGVQPLLDAVVDYLPSPLDVPPMSATDPDTGAVVQRPADDAAPFSALAFKVVSDPFVGRLVYVRVYSGIMKAGDGVFNSTRDKKERIGRLLLMHANHREEITEIDTGAIGATLGLKNTFTGDTLCDANQRVILESIKFPEPVISMAIEPKTRNDQEKLGDALQKLTEEDPTFRVKYDNETGQTTISGMGELHLDVIASRLLTEFHVGAKVGRPKVAYKETITETVKAEGRFIRQSGGHGQYGHCWIELSPLPKNGGFKFVDIMKGGTIPRNFIPPIEEGIHEAMSSGTLAGFEVVDVQATLYDGSFHDVDSSEQAFKMAGSIAFKAAMRKAKPILLEPVMKIELVTPEQFMGDLIGNVNSMRGRIQQVESRGDTYVIHSFVPLAETFGYVTRLRSITQGRATSTMEFHSYEEVPASVALEISERAVGMKNG